MGWQTFWNAGYSDIQVGPWSYTVPMLATKISTLINAMSEQPAGTSCSGAINVPSQTWCPYTCVGNNSVVFRGLDGRQYSLPIGDVYPSSGESLDMGKNCPAYPYNIQSPGNAHGILSWINASSSGISGATVVDQAGTTYSFPNWGNGQVPPYQYALSAVPPATITDRNGNLMTMTETVINNIPNYQFTDSTGRKVIAYTGPGNDGDTISVSGLGGTTQKPITVHWATTNVTFPESYQVAAGSSACTLSNTLNWGVELSGYSVPTYSIPVMNSIVLPNNQSYSFTYDGTYGKVSKITFPDGGYVRYAWGLNKLSQSTISSWVIPASDTNGNYTAPEQVSCTVYFDTPAITDRYVSYDGSTEVLHQHFAYGTSWSSQGSFVWTSKSTVVTTTDEVTGQASTTTYTYLSAPPDSVPYGGGAILSQIPIEANVLYQDGSGNTLKSEYKNWDGANLLSADETVLYSGGLPSEGSAVGYCYDANEQVTNLYEYGFQTEERLQPIRALRTLVARQMCFPPTRWGRWLFRILDLSVARQTRHITRSSQHRQARTTSNLAGVASTS